MFIDNKYCSSKGYSKLYFYRVNKRISIDDVSKFTGISVSYLNSLENGYKCNPTLDIIQKLICFFNCKFEDIF